MRVGLDERVLGDGVRLDFIPDDCVGHAVNLALEAVDQNPERAAIAAKRADDQIAVGRVGGVDLCQAKGCDTTHRSLDAPWAVLFTRVYLDPARRVAGGNLPASPTRHPPPCYPPGGREARYTPPMIMAVAAMPSRWTVSPRKMAARKMVITGCR